MGLTRSEYCHFLGVSVFDLLAPPPSYAEPLRICVVVYLQKAPELLNDVLRALVRHWPQCGSSKQSVMIETLEIMLVEMTAVGVLSLEPDVAISVAAVVARMLAVEHEQVALRALMVVDNQQAIGLLLGSADGAGGGATEATASAARCIGIALVGMREHWSQTARGECEEVVGRYCSDYMGSGVDAVQALYTAEKEEKAAAEQQRKDRWASLLGAAS